jgi:hypothetical protein
MDIQRWTLDHHMIDMATTTRRTLDYQKRIRDRRKRYTLLALFLGEHRNQNMRNNWRQQ